jgi:hypothetical protein
MNRAERLRVIGEVFEQASRTTAGRDALILAAREAGVGATTIQSTTGLSVRGARTLTRVISEETTRRLTASLRDVTLGVLGPVFSAMPSRLIGSASGSMNYIINLIDTGAPPGSTTL